MATACGVRRETPLFLDKGTDMHSREDYERAFAIVRGVVHDWDPYLLFDSGAPDDEWDQEVAILLTHLRKVHSVDDAAGAIREVFGEVLDQGKVSCNEVAHRLFVSLAEAHLLE